MSIIVRPQRIIWSWYNGRWWLGFYILYSEEGSGRGRSSPRPLLAVPNVTAHPSTVSVPITVLLYNGPLIIGFNVLIKGLKAIKLSVSRWKKWRNGPYYSEMLFRTKSHQRPNVTLKCIYFLCTFRIVNFLYVSYFDLEWPQTFKVTKTTGYVWISII